MDSVYDKPNNVQPTFYVPYKWLQLFNLNHIFLIRVRMIWNIGQFTNLLLKLKTKLGLYVFPVCKTRKFSKKTLLTTLEIEKLPDFENLDLKDNFFPKVTIYYGRIKVCMNYKTEPNKANFAAYSYQNNTFFKDTENELKTTEQEELFPKLFFLLKCFDIFSGFAFVFNKATVHIWNSFFLLFVLINGMVVLFVWSNFRFYSGLELSFKSSVWKNVTKKCMLLLERSHLTAWGGPKTAIWRISW